MERDDFERLSEAAAKLKETANGEFIDSVLQVSMDSMNFEDHVLVNMIFVAKATYLLDVYTQNRYNKDMIKNFADKETEKIFNQTFSRKLPHDIQKVALRKLIMINNAGCLEDLKVPPSNRLEPLTGKRQGQYSIRINDQFRICFREDENHFYDVEIVDYH